MKTKSPKPLSLHYFWSNLVLAMQAKGIRSFSNPQASWRKYERWLGRRVEYTDITEDNVEAYYRWLISDECSMGLNSAKLYVRYIKYVYKKYIKAYAPKDAADLSGIRCKSEVTAKRALTKAQLHKLKEFDGTVLENTARDIFLLSFYLMGMRPCDLFRLDRGDFNSSLKVIKYQASKTRKHHVVAVPAAAIELIEDGIMDLLKTWNKTMVNYHLRSIAGKLQMENFSMYAARHSWASLCNESSVPIAVISQGLGHSDIATTQIYLASISTDTMRKYNCKVAAMI